VPTESRRLGLTWLSEAWHAGGTGGLNWHLHAHQSRHRWQATVQALAAYLAGIQTQRRHLLLIGASAGWMMPPTFLQRFDRIDAYDIDTLSLLGRPLNPMERGPIDKVLDVGVKAINGMLTMGRGQRIGLVAGSGVGKSVLLGMLTRFTKADVVVIGLIGERGREVQAFISESLGKEGLAKSVVVASPANVSPVLRLKATHMTHVIAEYFRDQGLNVLMLVDSLTRVAHAQREIGLAIGEPPTAKGYPPSVFALLPNLIERAGVGRHGVGSITAIYTVLAEGDDASDPIVDIARASLDGQVMLSRKLADAAHYPAIDLTGSISRIMQSLLDPNDLKQANRFRRMWTLYQQNLDLIQVGAYERGTNPELDDAIRLHDRMVSFLQQDMHIDQDYESTRTELRALLES